VAVSVRLRDGKNVFDRINNLRPDSKCVFERKKDGNKRNMNTVKKGKIHIEILHFGSLHINTTGE
jgi:hypothetical protein